MAVKTVRTTIENQVEHRKRRKMNTQYQRGELGIFRGGGREYPPK